MKYNNTPEHTRRFEVIYSNHNLEFLRFYKSHKKICDEISGLKEHYRDEDNRIKINMTNFQIGINLLRAYVIDYFYIISDQVYGRKIMNNLFDLEKRFGEDNEFHKLIEKIDGLNDNKIREINEKYLKYLIEAFEIINLMSRYLQRSFNLSVKEIEKQISFINYDGFYENFNQYKAETSLDFSNISFEGLYDNYKKLLGYFYTYRYLFTETGDNLIKKHMDKLLEFILSDEISKNIIKLKNDAELSNTTTTQMKENLVIIKDAFSLIYNNCNKELSNKKILPKEEVDELEDNTLI